MGKKKKDIEGMAIPGFLLIGIGVGFLMQFKFPMAIPAKGKLPIASPLITQLEAVIHRPCPLSSPEPFSLIPITAAELAVA